jgi:hypothetical protein
MTPVTLRKAAMPQFTERDAEKLSPEQATALVRVLDLQAKWDGLLADKQQKVGRSDLLARQKANDAYQAALREYVAKYPKAVVPEPTHAVPERVAVWCRTLRVVLGRAEAGSAAEVMEKVYRLADRAAGRMSKEPVARTSVTDLAGAVRELDAVIAWCDALTPLKLKKDEPA